MTTSELEHAATSPCKFTAFIRRIAKPLDACTKLSPRVTRILRCNPYCGPHVLLDPDISAIYLVPGGRFLLTSMASVMSLWDLGYNSKVPIDHSPIASMRFTYDVNKFDVQATADDRGIRICIVATSPLSPTATIVKILEVSPLSSLVSFSQIAEFSIPHEFESLAYAFNKDLFSYNYLGCVGVRNFVCDMAVEWRIDQTEESWSDVRNSC
jgi:hypothetical protein